MLDEILDELPSIFYNWDDTFQLIRRNKKHDEITEYGEDDIADMDPMDFFDAAEHAKIAAAVDQVFTHGETTVEATFVTKSGKRIPHLFTAVRTIVNGNTVLMGFGVDLSKQKKTEQHVYST